MGLGGPRPANIAAPAASGGAAAEAAPASLNTGASSLSLAASTDPAALAAARAALLGAASAAAAAKDHGLVRVTETKRFAGKDVEVTRAVTQAEAAAVAAKQKEKKEKEEKSGKATTAARGREEDAAEAAPAAAAAAGPSSSKPLPNATAVGRSGLDATLAALDAASRRVNVVKKTRADWSQLKAADAGLDDELEKYKKGGDAHVEKKAFLARAERAAYERERDARLNSDVRTRGRL